ncbi:MAG: formylmethanofuran dehydrogenase subunit B [Candidatus Hydrothermarchaeales archaeon]
MTEETQLEEGAEVIKDVTCPVCGCSCDDIEITVKENKIIGVRHACRMGAAKFFETSGENRLKKPMIRVDGELREVTWEEAIGKAARILVDAKRPVLFGWAETSCEALRIGNQIAEELGGIMDNCSSICHAPSILAIQKVGISSCTLGEVKNRADLIIYWGSNPQASHPRHLSRYTTYPRGKFRERGRQDKEVIVVDVRESDTAKIADWYIQVKPNSDYEIFAALRSIVNGNEIYADKVGGVSKDDLYKLAEKMKSAQFGAIYFGLGIASSVGKSRNIENAIRLVTDLNRHTKFIIQAMRGHYNVAGTNQVLTWQHGFPYAVDFAKGYPEYNPGDTSVVDLLQRNEADAMFVIAADPGAHFPRRAVERMVEIPLIMVDVVENPTMLLADVVLPGVMVGAESEGTCYRMDDVPIPLRKVIDPLIDYVKSDTELMEKLYNRIMKIKGST